MFVRDTASQVRSGRIAQLVERQLDTLNRLAGTGIPSPGLPLRNGQSGTGARDTAGHQRPPIVRDSFGIGA